MDKMSEPSEDNVDALFRALLLDWEATHPAPASPIPAIWRTPPIFCTCYFARPRTFKSKNVCEYCQVNWNVGEIIH